MLLVYQWLFGVFHKAKKSHVKVRMTYCCQGTGRGLWCWYLLGWTLKHLPAQSDFRKLTWGTKRPFSGISGARVPHEVKPARHDLVWTHAMVQSKRQSFGFTLLPPPEEWLKTTSEKKPSCLGKLEILLS